MLNDPLPASLSIQLLDTQACLEIGAVINDFENSVFGHDFFCSFDKLQPWVNSGALFSSAICGEAVAGTKTILSLVSLFLTNRASRDRLLSGSISDYELSPWFVCPEGSEPVIYLSSIVSHSAEHRARIFGSLLNDLDRYLRSRKLEVRSGFAIATGPAGHKHLVRSGFVAIPEKKYLQKYDFMEISEATARISFWQCLLRARETALDLPTCWKNEEDLHSAAAQLPSLEGTDLPLSQAA